MSYGWEVKGALFGGTASLERHTGAGAKAGDGCGEDVGEVAKDVAQSVDDCPGDRKEP